MFSCELTWTKKTSKLGLLLKERICSKGSKFFPFRVDPKLKKQGGGGGGGRGAAGGRNENTLLPLKHSLKCFPYTQSCLPRMYSPWF